MIVGYARDSTVGQGLDIQVEQLEKHCEQIFQEKISGVKLDRPKLNDMIDVDQLTAKGVEFRVLNINFDTSTPTGKLMLTMLAGVAQFEREMMLERQAEGIAKAQAEGRYKGRPRKIDALVEPIKKLVSEGVSKAQIARDLQIGEATVYRALKL